MFSVVIVNAVVATATAVAAADLVNAADYYRSPTFRLEQFIERFRRSLDTNDTAAASKFNILRI